TAWHRSSQLETMNNPGPEQLAGLGLTGLAGERIPPLSQSGVYSMKGCSLIVVSLVTLATTPVPGIARDRAQQEQARLVAFPLKRVTAVLAAKKLRALLGQGGNVAIFSEEGSNTVFIRARPDKIQ